MMRRLALMLVLLIFAASVQARTVQAQTWGWSETVYALTREKTMAESCAAALKRHTTPGSVIYETGAADYREGRAETMAVISALIVSLAEEQTPAAMEPLRARVHRARNAQERFCTAAQALAPEDPGVKGIGEAVGGALQALVEGLFGERSDRREQDLLRRKTIETQLEAARWVAFEDAGGTE